MMRSLPGSAAMPSRSSSYVNNNGLKMKMFQYRRVSPTPGSCVGPKRLAPSMAGIIGIYKRDGPANVELYEGMLMLQHRGQDSAGMVTTDWSRFKEHKNHGMVKDVFDGEETMKILTGSSGIGHVSTRLPGSDDDVAELQPHFVNSPLGMYMVHNGRLTNTEELRAGLGGYDAFFNRHLVTGTDTEVLLNVVADEVHRAHQRCLYTSGCDVNKMKVEFLFEAGAYAMKFCRGAYSCLSLVSNVGLIAFRDPWGIRPLVIGKRSSPKGDEWCIASEDCAFGPIGFTRFRDVNPGEMVIITEEGQMSARQLVPGKLSPCMFEYIYKARPDSVLNKIPVYDFQLQLGTCLSKRIREAGWDIDLVCPVPDGSRPAAIQIASDLKLPYREGLVKNRYIGRTDRRTDKATREMNVRRKLNAMPAVFKDKNVLLVDDSIIRGTTMSQIVGMIRNAGAKKVYLASTSPPVKFPNLYGVTMSYQRCSFVANGRTTQEVQEVLGADGLMYQEIEDLVTIAKSFNPSIEQFDVSCFDGNYITGDIDEAYLQRLEQAQANAQANAQKPRQMV